MEGFDLINIPRRLSKHGGLIIYVNNTFSYSLLDLIPESDVFEGVFITIQNKQNPSVKYIIGDIYRPISRVVIGRVVDYRSRLI